MTPLKHLAFIGNSLPRRCGIATFTTDLQQAIATTRADVETSIVAITDHGRSYDYPSTVRFEIAADTLGDYARAAAVLNADHVDVVSLQHEFGIFGGDAGGHLVTLLSRLNMPIVTTLHTVLSEPTPAQRNVTAQIVAKSAKIVVMAEKGRRLLRTLYGVPADRIEVIPHGIPNVAFSETDAAKAKFGFTGRTVILTFGLLSPNKGIEVMIDAMPAILTSCPEAVYVVLGATHPNLVDEQGEAYRNGLIARARDLGIDQHVVFLDQFVDRPTLLDFIAMCDVYVTPYLNAAQMTSGTLAYSFGLGKAVVSTPYWHARELLADGRGVLVPFGDAVTMGREIASLLSNDTRRQAMRVRAYASSRSMTWERTAARYLATFEDARRGDRRKLVVEPRQKVYVGDGRAPPEMQLGHLRAMCDDTGLLQHAIYNVPDRAHGYCVDDNARALLVACALNAPDEQHLPDPLIAQFAAFVQHAWNPDTQRFRNFMNFDRRWLEDQGSEDSHGRTLWALGECVRGDTDPSRQRWAAALFIKALPAVDGFRSPRAWASTLLGLDSYCTAAAGNPADSRGVLSTALGHLDPDLALAEHFRNKLADRLMSLLVAVETSDWVWFENGLTYDNARLSQALIVTGTATERPELVAAGLRSLRWLMAQQTTLTGQFRPVGTDGFGETRQPPRPFDQQPLEATAAISACLAAWRADGDVRWKDRAARAFAWFLGDNDMSLPLVDIKSGSCRDGLHPDRRNENAGGESVVSYLLALAEIRQLARMSGDRPKLEPLAALSA